MIDLAIFDDIPEYQAESYCYYARIINNIFNRKLKINDISNKNIYRYGTNTSEQIKQYTTILKDNNSKHDNLGATSDIFILKDDSFIKALDACLQFVELTKQDRVLVDEDTFASNLYIYIRNASLVPLALSDIIYNCLLYNKPIITMNEFFQIHSGYNEDD